MKTYQFQQNVKDMEEFSKLFVQQVSELLLWQDEIMISISFPCIDLVCTYCGDAPIDWKRIYFKIIHMGSKQELCANHQKKFIFVQQNRLPEIVVAIPEESAILDFEKTQTLFLIKPDKN